MREEVVLVDEANNPIGTMPKSEVHGKTTPLHRGFSVFLFNAEKKLLVQQRSRFKKTWPLVWSNSVCGHPLPGESVVSAAKRRLAFELGMNGAELEEVAPYRYQVSKDGVMENEICPILLGETEEAALSNPDEVEAVQWITWEEFLAAIKREPTLWSPWCIEEADILEKTPAFQLLMKSEG